MGTPSDPLGNSAALLALVARTTRARRSFQVEAFPWGTMAWPGQHPVRPIEVTIDVLHEEDE